MRRPRDVVLVPLALWVSVSAVIHVASYVGGEQYATKRLAAADRARGRAGASEPAPGEVEFTLTPPPAPAPPPEAPAPTVAPPTPPAPPPRQHARVETPREHTPTPPTPRPTPPHEAEPHPTLVARAAPPPPRQAPPRMQHVDQQNDNNEPTPADAQFLAQSNHDVREQTVATVRNLNQNDPHPQTGGTPVEHQGDRQGNGDRDVSADDRDRAGNRETIPTASPHEPPPEAQPRRAVAATAQPPQPAPAAGANANAPTGREGHRGAPGTRGHAAAVAAAAPAPAQPTNRTPAQPAAPAPAQPSQPSQPAATASTTGSAPAAGTTGPVVTSTQGAGAVAVGQGQSGGASGGASASADANAGQGGQNGQGGQGGQNGGMGIRGLGAAGAIAALTPSLSAYSQVYGPQAEEERRLAELRRSRARGNYTDSWRINRAAIENYTPAVRVGNQTALRTAANPFSAYLTGMHRRIHRLFADEFLASLGNLPASAPLNDTSLVTTLEIVLSSDGRIHRLGVVRPSGNMAFDVASLNAVRHAGPFGAAPQQILSGDGRVYMRWGFYRNERQCGTFNAEPYILPNPGGGPSPQPAAPVPAQPASDHGTAPPASVDASEPRRVASEN